MYSIPARLALLKSRPNPHLQASNSPSMRVETKASYWQLWLIILAFSAPVILSYTWFYLMPPQITRSNYGHLVQPLRPLDLLGLQPVGSVSPAADQPQWTVLHLAAGCAPDCQQALFYTRQEQTLLNKDQGRVRRVLVLMQPWPEAELAPLRQTDPELRILTGHPEQLQDLVARLSGLPQSPLQGFYLVDPLGNLMMSYPLAADPKGVLKDLKHLMKWSRTG